MRTHLKKSILIVIPVLAFIMLLSVKSSNKEENINQDALSEYNCYWEETFGSNISGKRGNACGSDTSLRIYFTNPYNYRVRVAFYLRDENGRLNDRPWVVGVNPGKTTNHHKCRSNGRYIILAARDGDNCRFPKLN